MRNPLDQDHTEEEALCNRKEALCELEDVLCELSDLSSRARKLLSDNFPASLTQLEAYGALDFGSSSNPYDTTFEKAVNELLGGEE